MKLLILAWMASAMLACGAFGYMLGVDSREREKNNDPEFHLSMGLP